MQNTRIEYTSIKLLSISYALKHYDNCRKEITHFLTITTHLFGTREIHSSLDVINFHNGAYLCKIFVLMVDENSAF